MTDVLRDHHPFGPLTNHMHQCWSLRNVGNRCLVQLDRSASAVAN